MQENTIEKKASENKHIWLSWLLWWRIEEHELSEQVSQYDTLPIHKSAKGLSFLLFAVSAAFTVIAVLFLNFTAAALLDVVILLVLGFLVYKGYQWAIITAMVVWTVEKMYSLTTANPIITVVWWAIYMHVLFLAFKVERVRKNRSNNTEDSIGKEQ